MLETSLFRQIATLHEPAPWRYDEGEPYVDIAEVCGPSWWAVLHGVAEAIRDHGCSTCGGFAVDAIVALHDLVNAKLGKAIKNQENLSAFAHLYNEAATHGSDWAEVSQAQTHLSPDAILLDISGEGEFVRERWQNPDAFHPESFRTIVQDDHRLVLACPQAEWLVEDEICAVDQGPVSRLHPRDELDQLLNEAMGMGIPVEGPMMSDTELDQIEQLVKEVLAQGSYNGS